MRPESAKHLLILSTGLMASLLLLIIPSDTRAQEAGPDATSTAARKFDEFDRVGGCDHSARLDNFAIELMNNPRLTGYIIAYGPEGDASGTGNFRLRVSKNYLINSRGIDEERIKIIYGGPYKNLDESATELWLAPPGAAAPVPVKYENKAGEFTGKFLESEAQDLLFQVDESTGPPVGDVRLANFADMLRQQPRTRAFLVAYNSAESAPGAWRRVATREAENLRDNYGVKDDRIKIIFGGYETEAKLQLWILPIDAPPPVAEAQEDRKLEKAIQLGTFEQFQLKYNDGAQLVFKEFVDALNSDQKLKACIIIHPEIPGPAQTNADESAEPATSEAVAPDEVPDIDLLQLVEKWKKDLEKDYGIKENRIVVLVAPTTEDDIRAGQLETWVIPPNVALPDPYAAEAEEEVTEPELSEPDEQNPQKGINIVDSPRTSSLPEK